MNLRTKFSKGKHFLISLQVNLHTIFLSLFLFIVSLIVALEYISFSKLLLLHSKKSLDAATASVNRELTELLNSTVPLSHLSESLLQRKVIDPEDLPTMVDYTKSVLKSLPAAVVVDWGNKNGSFAFSRRLLDGTIMSGYVDTTKKPLQVKNVFRDKNENIVRVVDVTSDYNPLTRPWYRIAQAGTTTRWTNAFIFRSHSSAEKNVRYMGISAATAIDLKDDFLGVFAIDIRLDSISRFLSTYKVSKNSLTFIVDNFGNIIAYPNLYAPMPINPEEAKTPKLTNITALKNSVALEAFNNFNKTHKQEFTFKFHDENYLTSFSLISQFKDYHWYIVSVIPEDDFIGQMKVYNMYIMVVILFLLLLGLLLISIFSKQVSSPINKLAHELDQIKYFNIKPSPPIKTHIKEVSTIYHSMESMKVGLESFKKYVPEKLVRHLIASGEAAKIGGKMQPLTLLFSDIADFTLISEQIGADKIMNYLCEYFNELSVAINEYNGTIDKYIGDSVMAFWGAPLSDSRGIENACFSALSCQKRIEALNEKWYGDGVSFITRFGIHYGDAIIGNIGSKERLNYTAIGDTVNLTSRLEHLNKYYGSKIIVSESVYQKVSDIFLFRILDLVITKGRATPTNIYQLFQQKSADMDSKLLDFCDFYTKGFFAYKQQNWDAAITEFQHALLIDPDDMASRLMISRCNKFKINPPPANWRGIWVYTDK